DALENEIVPLFYDRGNDGIPRGWLAKMRAAIATVAPVFSLDRMLKEYYNKYYFPASRYGQRVEASSAARDLAEWAQRVRQGWPEVSLTASTALVDGQPVTAMAANGPATITATLRPGRLSPESLTVELVYGSEHGSEQAETQIVPLRLAAGQDGEFTYAGEFGPIDRGAVTYGVRVRPHHPALSAPFIVPLVKWA
ncbi:MAG: glycogen phosphorylase, partial [Chloroflexota bacterium]|nr:glycogen phosphorylase [Chloroflexota bacterium]